MSILTATAPAGKFKPLRCLEPARKARRPRRPTRPRPRPEPLRIAGGARRNYDRWTTIAPATPGIDLGAEEYRPTSAPDFAPTALDDAWWAGFCLGVDGEYPAAPDHYDDRECFDFCCGRLAGFQHSDTGRVWAADMKACRERLDAREIHHAELVEANGADFARTYR